MKNLRLLIFLVIFAVACGASEQKKYEKSGNLSNDYAEKFMTEKYENLTKITVKNPWQNAENEQFVYYLLPQGASVPDSLTEKPIIRTPVGRVICLSTTHLGYIEALDERHKIVGLSGTSYVFDSTVNEMIEQKKIQEIGFTDNLNIEKIVSLSPDVVFVFDLVGSLNPKFETLSELGVNVIFVAEYLEKNPLGKAEWIKFFGEFFEKSEKAKNYFDFVKKSYNEQKKLVAKCQNRPKVLVNIPFQGVWYVPGGNSYVAKLIDQAGGEYPWKNNRQAESQAISLEDVFALNSELSVLINAGISQSISDILKIDPRLAELNCIKNKQVYNNNKRVNPNGGNDFWESGTVNVHLILQDLSAIFQPDLYPEHNYYYYYKKIE